MVDFPRRPAVKLVTLAVHERDYRAIAADMRRHQNWPQAEWYELRAEQCVVAAQDAEGRQ